MPLAVRRFLAIAAFAVWIASLSQPTLKTTEPWDDGWFVLMIGGLGLMVGYVDWLANPVAIALLARLWLGKPLSKLDLLGSTFLVFIVILNMTRTEIADNEGGVLLGITQWFLGFYLWLAALTMTAGSVFGTYLLGSMENNAK